MGVYVDFTNEQEIVRLHVEENLSCSKIATLCGCSWDIINTILVKHGVYERDKSNISKQELELIKKHIASGKTVREIAKEMKLSNATISNRISRFNLRDGVEKKPVTHRKNEKRQLCAVCKYRVSRQDWCKGMRCNYIELMHHSRGCDVEDCDKFEKERR